MTADGRLERGDFTLKPNADQPLGWIRIQGASDRRNGTRTIHELVTQLRGEAGKRQVDDARLAIQENGGGLYGIEEAVVAINILAKQ